MVVVRNNIINICKAIQVIEMFTLSYSWWVLNHIRYEIFIYPYIDNHRIAGLDLQLWCYSRIASNPYIINVSRVGLNSEKLHEYRILCRYLYNESRWFQRYIANWECNVFIKFAKYVGLIRYALHHMWYYIIGLLLSNSKHDLLLRL